MEPATVGLEEEANAASGELEFSRPSAEDLAWLGLVPLTLVVLAVVFWLGPPLSHLYPGPNETIFAGWRFLVRPEPLESTRYLIAAAAPPLLAGLVLAIGTGRGGRRSLDLAVIAIQVAGLGFICWSVAHQTHAPGFTPPTYFDPILLSVPNVVAGVVIGACLTALFASRVELRLPQLGTIRAWLAGKWGIAVAVAVAFTAIWVLPAVVTDGTVGSMGEIGAGHVPAQAEDYFAVANGRTPLVDYIPIYVHLLPLVLEPVLRTFALSLTSFSISMCLLSLLTLLTAYGTFVAVTRRTWAALALYMPFVALALFPWDREGAVWDYNGIYYAFLPGRYLGPFLVAWLCALHLRGRRMPAWGVFFAAGLAVANNTEFGLPCLVAAILALVFGAERASPAARLLKSLAVQLVIGLAAAVVLVCGVLLLRSGHLPNPSYATYWSALFARDGYGLVRMPTLGLHWALYFTYGAALLVAAVRYVRRDPDQTLTGMLVFAGIFGLLSGFYFAGRSLPWQLMLLFPAWGLALALLTWTVVGSLRSARGDWLQLRRMILPGFAVLAGFGVMVASIDRTPPPWQQIDRLSAGGTAVNDVPAVQRFVDANTTPGEHVLIIGTSLDHRVAERAGVVNTSPFFSPVALLSAREVNRAIDFLGDEGGTKVFESPLSNALIAHHQFPEIERILRQRGFAPVRHTPVTTGFVEWERQ